MKTVSKWKNEKPQIPTASVWLLNDLAEYRGNQVVADLDASGNMLRTYTWGPGIDNLLAMTVCGSETNTYYALKDHQNSVLAFTDASGTIVESYEYDAYGNILDMKDSSGSSIANHQSEIGNRYLWQGREYDSATGLYYFRARWYDPETGRWLSKDPIGISGGLNLYVFCGNNPVNFVDPDGLDTYWVNREPGDTEPRSRFNPISHSYLAVTDKNGTVVATYSWGNNADFLKKWALNAGGDVSAAQKAIDQGMASRRGSSSLDPYVARAHELLAKINFGNGSPWLPTMNCKNYAEVLLTLANMLHAAGCR